MHRILYKFVSIAETMSKYTGIAVSVCIPLMAGVLFVEIVSRSLFNYPTIWVHDLSIFLFGYCGLLGGANALLTKQHITMDILYEKLSPRKQAALDLISFPLFLIFIVVLIIYGLKDTYYAFEIGLRSNTEWGPPIGHYRLMLPIGAILLLIQGIAEWIKALYLTITGKELK